MLRYDHLSLSPSLSLPLSLSEEYTCGVLSGILGIIWTGFEWTTDGLYQKKDITHKLLPSSIFFIS